jgi:hypothetical protein
MSFIGILDYDHRRVTAKMVALVIALCCIQPTESHASQGDEKAPNMSKRYKVVQFPIAENSSQSPLGDALWSRILVGTPPDEVRGKLKERWSSEQWSGLEAFRDMVLEYEPKGLTTFDGAEYLFLFHARDALFLPQPPDREAVMETLTGTPFEGNEELATYLSFFGGMKEDPTMAGYFLDPVQEKGLRPLRAMVDDAKDRYGDKWANAMILFHSLGGDLLCLDREGNVGWQVMDDIETIKRFAPTFDESLKRLASIMSKRIRTGNAVRTGSG